MGARKNCSRNDVTSQPKFYSPIHFISLLVLINYNSPSATIHLHMIHPLLYRIKYYLCQYNLKYFRHYFYAYIYCLWEPHVIFLLICIVLCMKPLKFVLWELGLDSPNIIFQNMISHNHNSSEDLRSAVGRVDIQKRCPSSTYSFLK